MRGRDNERPTELDDDRLAAAAPQLDDLERARTKASLRRKLFGRTEDEIRVGRFVVIKRVGAGGMGVVYAAYDSELDRKVALKLIRPETDETEPAQSRLLREARALAKLSHPNVVQIYDVGTHEGQVWIAMEFVDGRDLAAWSSDEPRHSASEIIELFLAAGRGLCAAHAAGLVHRDFKPANVLVGRDGQVRVVDFGLARAIVAPGRDEPTVPADGSPEVELSHAGALLGTPAYMSPEQHLGRELDARTDQFSFCVALYEALYGERPFRGDSLAQLGVAVTSGQLRDPPRLTQVPDRVRRILARGLSPEPEHRYPTLDALLADLAHDPALRRRRLVVAAGFVSTLVLAIAATWVARDDDEQLCSGAPERLAGVWDAARRGAVEHALLATELPLARDTANRVTTAMDEYAAEWSRMHIDACRATQLGEQSQHMLDLRMRCLDRRLKELHALVDVLAEADEQVVQSATEAVARLPALEHCADLEALAAEVEPPSDPRRAAAVEQVRTSLARATAREDGGKYKEALDVARGAVEAAQPLDYAPVLAEALLRRGELELELGEFEAAERSASEAYWTAMDAKYDRVAATAASTMVRVLARMARHDEGLVWVRHAETLVKRLEARGQERALFLESWAELLDRHGNYADAREHLEQALLIRTERLGAGHPSVAATTHQLGRVAYLQGEFEPAQRYFERAIEIQTAALGPEHPGIGRALTGLGTTLKRRRDYQGARRVYERSVALTEAAFGRDHPAVARDLNNLGNLLRRVGDHARARELQTRALAIREHAFGSEHPLVAQSLSNLALVLEEEGDLAAAQTHYERARAIREERLGTEHRDFAQSLDNLGCIAHLRGEHAGAVELHRRAHGIRERLLAPDHPEIGWGLTQLARAELAHGSRDEALRHADQALAIFRAQADTEPESLAQARFVRAQAVWDEAARHDEALALARLAREGFIAAGAPSRRDLAQVDRWLDVRGSR